MPQLRIRDVNEKALTNNELIVEQDKMIKLNRILIYALSSAVLIHMVIAAFF